METATPAGAPGSTSRFSDRNCFRVLHWRYAAARRAIEDGDTAAVADAALDEIIAFERAMDRARCPADIDRVAWAWPGLAAANSLSTTLGPLRNEVEARILAGEDDFVIAARCGLTAEAVRCYEAAFFNVRDRLRTRAWIATWALDPAGQGGMGMLWRTVAYFGGPLALDIVLAITRGMPMPSSAVPTPDDDRPAAEARLRLLARLVAAADQAQMPAELLDLIGTGAGLRDDLDVVRCLLDLAAA